MKRILLIGNHSCANRGDAAILRGLLTSLGNKAVEVHMASRDPVSCELILGTENIPILDDALYRARQKITQGSLINRILLSKYLNGVMYFSSIFDWSEKFTFALLPNIYKEAVKSFKNYDYIIQVGGSFIVDSYGLSQLDIIFAAKLAKKDIYLVGHSVGPFEHTKFRAICKKLLKYPKKIFLREQASKQILLASGIELANIDLGSDTAWLMPEAVPYKNDQIGLNDRPLVAITARKLAPFDRTLGVSQESYEKRMAEICSDLINRGYGIVGLSTCTGLNSYHRDDRIALYNIKKRVTNKKYFNIVLDELSDLQLGGVFSCCQFTLATRLHSGIISMRYGVPALVIAYEHKSQGILNDMDLSELSLTMEEFLGDSFNIKLDHMLVDMPNIRKKLKEKVVVAQKKAELQVEEVVN